METVHQPTPLGEEARIVFIGGLHRSGTSLLNRILGGHHLVSTFQNTGVPEDEGQHLQSAYPPASRFGGPGRFGFQGAAYMDEMHPLATEKHRSLLWSEWSRHWDLDAHLLVEKSPPNLIRTRFLQALFPGASFIMMIRHPIPVALATQKWARTVGLCRLIEHWVVCHERFQRDRSHLERILVLRYEDLVHDHRATLVRIWDFLDIPPIHRTEVRVLPYLNAKYFSEWHRRLRGVIKGPYLRRCIRQFQPRVRAFDYDLERI